MEKWRYRHPGHFTPLVKAAGTLWVRSWTLDNVQQRRIFCLFRESNPVRPVLAIATEVFRLLVTFSYVSISKHLQLLAALHVYKGTYVHMRDCALC
jgi:hypothetical protein